MNRSLSAFIAAMIATNCANAADAPSSSLPTFATMSTGNKPAVDGVNTKVEVFGGATFNNSTNTPAFYNLAPTLASSSGNAGAAGIIGTIAAPLGNSFGVQIDVGAGTFGSNPLGGAAGHLFWRDPDKGLVGLYGNGIISSAEFHPKTWTAASEFEAYLSQFTLRAIIGVQGLNVSFASSGFSAFRTYGLPTSFTKSNYFLDNITLTFYPTEDLALSIGQIYSFGSNAITGQIEYIFPQFRGNKTAPSVFVSAAYAPNNSSNVMAGARVYFGTQDKSLMRRQREDDPVSNFVLADIASNMNKMINQNKDAQMRLYDLMLEIIRNGNK